MARALLTRSRRISLLALVLAIGTVAAISAVGLGRPPWWLFVAVVLAVIATESAEIRFVVGSEVWTLALTEVVLAAIFVTAPGGWVSPACGIAVISYTLARRQSALKVAYNGTQFACATAIGSVVSAYMGASVVGAVGAIFAFIVVNSALVTAAIKIATGRPLRQLITMGSVVQAVQALGSASVGILGGWLSMHAPVGLVGLLVPVALIWYSYRTQVRQAAETRMFSELATGHEQLSGRSIDTSARVVASAARRLLTGEVELIVLTGASPVRYATDGDLVSSQNVDQTALSAGWVLEALGRPGMTVGVADRAPYLLSRLGSDEAPTAILKVVRPVQSVNFERRDQMMASVLFRQAESWLAMVELTEARDEAVARAEMADAANRVIGDLGTETIPALMQLRESAVRLSRLANTATSRDGVGDIVEELHAAERAVASLLGAIAMAADTALAEEIIQLPTGSSMGEDDWTTTGTLDLEVVDGTP
jgi:hypothetical protein